MYFQAPHLAHQIRFQWQSRTAVTRFAHTGQHAKDRIKPCAKAPAGKVSRFSPQSLMPLFRQIKQIMTPFFR